MIPLQSMLAMNFITENLPMIALVMVGIVVALAFAWGFNKGFRKASWDGIAWMVASGLFIAVGMLVPMEGSNLKGSFAISLSMVLACSIGTLGGFGALAYFLRPRIRWIKDDINSDMSLAEYGLEFEPEYVDYDGEHETNPYGLRIYKTGYGAPTFVNRLFGGIACAIYAGMVLAVLLGAGLCVVGVTSLKEGALGALLNVKEVKAVMPYVKTYLFEVISIGVILITAKQGFAKGFVESVRSLGITIAAFGAVGFSFYLPFSHFAKEGVLKGLVEGCTGIFEKFGPLSGILGGLFTGMLILTVVSFSLILINVLLKRLCAMIASVRFTRGVDGCLSAVLFAIIGAALCVGVWFVFAALDILGVFSVGQFISEKAYFSYNVFQFAKEVLENLFASLL